MRLHGEVHAGAEAVEVAVGVVEVGGRVGVVEEHVREAQQSERGAPGQALDVVVDLVELRDAVAELDEGVAEVEFAVVGGRDVERGELGCAEGERGRRRVGLFGDGRQQGEGGAEGKHGIFLRGGVLASTTAVIRLENARS